MISSPARLANALRPVLLDVGEFSRVVLPGYRLRGYQLGPARAFPVRERPRMTSR